MRVGCRGDSPRDASRARGLAPKGQSFTSLRPRRTVIGTCRQRKPHSFPSFRLSESWTRYGSAQRSGRACVIGVASRWASPVCDLYGTPRLHCLNASFARFGKESCRSRSSCRALRLGLRCSLGRGGPRVAASDRIGSICAVRRFREGFPSRSLTGALSLIGDGYVPDRCRVGYVPRHPYGV